MRRRLTAIASLCAASAWKQRKKETTSSKISKSVVGNREEAAGTSRITEVMRSTARTGHTSPHANKPAAVRKPVFENEGPHERNPADIRITPWLALRRAIDVFGVSIMLAFFAPVWVVTALLARLDGGPTLLRDERIGGWWHVDRTGRSGSRLPQYCANVSKNSCGYGIA